MLHRVMLRLHASAPARLGRAEHWTPYNRGTQVGVSCNKGPLGKHGCSTVNQFEKTIGRMAKVRRTQIAVQPLVGTKSIML